MLKIKNGKGEELMTIGDDGKEEFQDLKFKEEYDKAGKQQEKKQSKGE